MLGRSCIATSTNLSFVSCCRCVEPITTFSNKMNSSNPIKKKQTGQHQDLNWCQRLQTRNSICIIEIIFSFSYQLTSRRFSHQVHNCVIIIGTYWLSVSLSSPRDIEKSIVHRELERGCSLLRLTSTAGCVVNGATLPNAGYLYLNINNRLVSGS